MWALHHPILFLFLYKDVIGLLIQAGLLLATGGLIRVGTKQAKAADAQAKAAIEQVKSAQVQTVVAQAQADAAAAQVEVARSQLRVYERQYEIMSDALVASNKSADASLRSVAALEKLERPFLMIEVRRGSGGERRNQVWTVNKGKVPAQIIWWNPAPMFISPEHDEKLPQDYGYGVGYYDPMEIINVEWLAPEDEMHLCYFDASLVELLPDNVRRDVSEGRRVIYYLSALKYRGMLNDTIYESRWCFRWPSTRGLFLSGPSGYNKYT
jgi:hypothetical protein